MKQVAESLHRLCLMSRQIVLGTENLLFSIELQDFFVVLGQNIPNHLETVVQAVSETLVVLWLIN